MVRRTTQPAISRQQFPNGFTLVELLVVVTLIVIASSIALPAFSAYYEKGCIMAAVSEIAGMIREAKQFALVHDRCYALGFSPASGKVSLISGRGPDGKWNTGDDPLVRTFRLADKGGGLRFGYGSYGPLPGLAADRDGVTFRVKQHAGLQPRSDRELRDGLYNLPERRRHGDVHEFRGFRI